MSKLRIERIGGLAGFGGRNAHLRSLGEMDTNELSDKDRQVITALFATSGKFATDIAGGDLFKYKISIETANGTEDIEVGEDKVPIALIQRLKDEFI